MALVPRSLLSALLTIAAAGSLSLGAATASAQDDDESFSLDEEGESKKAPPPKKVKPAPGPTQEQLLGDEQALQEERAPQETFRDTTDPYEDPKKRYIFFGAGWKFAHIPEWMLGGYGIESGPAVTMPAGFGAELAFRRSGFQVSANVGYTKMALDGAYQLKGDSLADTEWLEGSFKLLNLTAVVTWSTSFADWFALEYGLEAGIGLVFGDLYRSEAVYQNGGWSKCDTWASQRDSGPLFNEDFPNPTAAEEMFCEPPIPDDPDDPPPSTNAADEEGAHYGVKAKRGLMNGGVPNVVPILGPRLSLRFKPIHQIVIRVDVPLPVIPFGIQGGVTAQYGF